MWAVDLRGHGGSAWPGAYSIEEMASDVEALLPMLSADLDLVGHSLGGLVACQVAARDGHTVRRLVLEDIGVPHPRPPAWPQRPEGELSFDWQVVEQIRPEIDDPDPGWSQLLSRIDIPVLVIGGGPSSFVPQDQVNELVATVRQGTQVTIDAGHEIHRIRPVEFLDQVRTFLDS